MALSEEQRRDISSFLGPRCVILSAGIAKLHLASPDPSALAFISQDSILYQYPELSNSAWTDAEVQGALVFVADAAQKCTLFQIYSMTRKNAVLFEYELYENIEYLRMNETFHTFEMEECVAGFAFCEPKVAEKFFQKVIERRPMRKALPQKPIPGKQAQTQVTSRQSKKQVAASTKPAKKKNKRTKASKKGKGININDIGKVMNVQHRGHIGISENGAVDIRNLPVEWKQLFKQVGIKKKDLRDKETAAAIFNTIQTEEMNSYYKDQAKSQGINQTQLSSYYTPQQRIAFEKYQQELRSYNESLTSPGPTNPLQSNVMKPMPNVAPSGNQLPLRTNVTQQQVPPMPPQRRTQSPAPPTPKRTRQMSRLPSLGGSSPPVPNRVSKQPSNVSHVSGNSRNERQQNEARSTYLQEKFEPLSLRRQASQSSNQNSVKSYRMTENSVKSYRKTENSQVKNKLSQPAMPKTERTTKADSRPVSKSNIDKRKEQSTAKSSSGFSFLSQNGLNNTNNVEVARTTKMKSAQSRKPSVPKATPSKKSSSAQGSRPAETTSKILPKENKAPVPAVENSPSPMESDAAKVVEAPKPQIIVEKEIVIQKEVVEVVKYKDNEKLAEMEQKYEEAMAAIEKARLEAEALKEEKENLLLNQKENAEKQKEQLAQHQQEVARMKEAAAELEAARMKEALEKESLAEAMANVKLAKDELEKQKLATDAEKREAMEKYQATQEQVLRIQQQVEETESKLRLAEERAKELPPAPPAMPVLPKLPPLQKVQAPALPPLPPLPVVPAAPPLPAEVETPPPVKKLSKVEKTIPKKPLPKGALGASILSGIKKGVALVPVQKQTKSKSPPPGIGKSTGGLMAELNKAILRPRGNNRKSVQAAIGHRLGRMDISNPDKANHLMQSLQQTIIERRQKLKGKSHHDEENDSDSEWSV